MTSDVIWMRAEAHILVKISLSAKTYRIIPSHYPPIQIFESCLQPEDLEAIYELESLTNDRLQDEVGDLRRVAPEDRISGPGTSVIMASFTHTGMASRFTDGSFGVYYAGLQLDTAIAETKYWQEKQMSESNEPPFERNMRVYVAKLNPSVGDFIDLSNDDEAHHPERYEYPQLKGREYRSNGEHGIYYRSVRNPGGNCIAVFRPAIISPAVQSMHIRYCWNGKKIFDVYEVKDLNM